MNYCESQQGSNWETIARSGTLIYGHNWRWTELSLYGQFGVEFFSAFLVADRAIVSPEQNAIINIFGKVKQKRNLKFEKRHHEKNLLEEQKLHFIWKKI
jgi:hypothetical protein